MTQIPTAYAIDRQTPVHSDDAVVLKASLRSAAASRVHYYGVSVDQPFRLSLHFVV